jgi:hypothetical protein
MILPVAIFAAALVVPRFVDVPYELDSVSAQYIDRPRLQTVGSIGARYKIKVETVHDRATGTNVRVQIIPGMTTPVDIACESTEPGCIGREPSREVVQKLFKKALNEALRMNRSDFGQYTVVRCERESPSLLLELQTAAMVGLDTKLVYTVGDSTGWALQYVLKYKRPHEKKPPYVRFELPAPASPNDAVTYVLERCGNSRKNSTARIVTQIDTRQLTRKTTAGSSPNG